MNTKIAFPAVILVCGIFSMLKHFEQTNVASRTQALHRTENSKLNPAMFPSPCGDAPSRKQPVAPISLEEAERRLDCRAH
jgi:hypothetical protein